MMRGTRKVKGTPQNRILSNADNVQPTMRIKKRDRPGAPFYLSSCLGCVSSGRKKRGGGFPEWLGGRFKG